MDDILITPFTPARTSGRGLRTCAVIAAMARRRTVEVVYVPFGGGAVDPALAADPGVRLLELAPSRGAARILAVLRALAHGVPWGLARGVSPELIAAAKAAQPGRRVIADGPTVAAALFGEAAKRPVVYLAHNLESSFRGSRTLRRFERRVLRRFAESWMCTPQDMDGARALAGDGIRLREVPNVIDVAGLPAPTAREGSRAGSGRILFVGDFTYAPNRDGYVFLTREVMPLVWDELPAAHAVLVGRGLVPDGVDPRIEVRGFVDDLDAAYAEADVVAVPLLWGGGSPLKLVEALARGLPVVATQHASDLIVHATPGEHLLAASDAPAFAAALIDVLRDGGGDLGPRGRALVAEHLSVDALEARVA